MFKCCCCGHMHTIVFCLGDVNVPSSEPVLATYINTTEKEEMDYYCTCILKQN